MILPDIEQVKAIVAEAGQLALTRFGAARPEIKADTTFVTEMDRAVERMLAQRLGALDPSFAFLGEEYGMRGDPGAPTWVCDPIDGTVNYVFGMHHWGVSVGLIVDGRSQLGVFEMPSTGETYWGVRGGGAWRGAERLHAPDISWPDPEDTVCLTSTSMKTLNTEVFNARLRCLGSIAAELVYTARGALRATIGVTEGVTDMAASYCICEEAGCVFRYLDGTPLTCAELMEIRRTSRHFAVGPPGFVERLCATVHPR